MPTTTRTASHTSQRLREGFVVLGRARAGGAVLTGGGGVETASCSSVSGDCVGVLGLSGICLGELFHFLLSELGPQRQGLRPSFTNILDAKSKAGVSHLSVAPDLRFEGRLLNRNGGPSLAMVTSGLRGPSGSQPRRLSYRRLS